MAGQPPSLTDRRKEIDEMKRRFDRWAFPLLAAALTLALLLGWACGGGDGEEAQDTPLPTQPREEATLEPTTAATALEDTVGSVLAAIDLIDTTGFHDMAKDLAEATELSPRYASQVGNVLAGTKAAAWPAELEEPLGAFVADVEALKAALDAEDLAAAATAAEPVHDTQHDLSEATYEWLDAQAGKLVSVSPHGMMAISMGAIDIVDSSGFHDMAKELAEATEINPRLAGKVGKALTVATVAAWAEDVHEPLDTLLADLETLKAALEAGDLDGARAAAEAVHDSQHDFSVAVYAWLGTQQGMAYDAGAMVTVCNLKAQDMIDSAGFHDLAKEMAEATEINPRWSSKVGSVITVTKAADWSDDVKGEVGAFVADLESLQTALDAGDLEGAAAAAEAVHDSQHDLSKATYSWVSAMPMMGAH